MILLGALLHALVFTLQELAEQFTLAARYYRISLPLYTPAVVHHCKATHKQPRKVNTQEDICVSFCEIALGNNDD